MQRAPLNLMLGLFIALCVILTLADHSAAAPASMLKQGSTGQDVLQLQRQLQALGYSIVADGKFGPATSSAVREFQRSMGLRQDGIAGPQTLSAIVARRQQLDLIRSGIYIVERGDSISSIASRLGFSADDLAQANRMSVQQRLYIGQAIRLPSRVATSLPPTMEPLLCPVDATPQPRIALTFDDCDEPLYFEQILSLLDEHSIVATFFLSLQTVLTSPEMLRSLDLSGHAVENQGSRMIGANSTFEELSQSILATRDAVSKVLGRNTQFYRPSQAHLSVEFTQAASLSGHKLVMWSNLGTPEAGHLLTATCQALFDGAVLRFSLGDPEVPAMLPLLIEHLRASRFVTTPLGSL